MKSDKKLCVTNAAPPVADMDCAMAKAAATVRKIRKSKPRDACRTFKTPLATIAPAPAIVAVTIGKAPVAAARTVAANIKRAKPAFSKRGNSRADHSISSVSRLWRSPSTAPCCPRTNSTSPASRRSSLISWRSMRARRCRPTIRQSVVWAKPVWPMARAVMREPGATTSSASIKSPSPSICLGTWRIRWSRKGCSFCASASDISRRVAARNSLSPAIRP